LEAKKHNLNKMVIIYGAVRIYGAREGRIQKYLEGGVFNFFLKKFSKGGRGFDLQNPSTNHDFRAVLN